jgi:hypothetical protein
MKEINIAEADIAAVIQEIKRLGPDVRGFGTVDPAWSRPPAVLVIDCVLSLNTKYDGFVVPRLEGFMNNRPEIQKVKDLANLMESFPTPHAFMLEELNYNYEARAMTLQSVVEYVCKIVAEVPKVSEEEAIKKWAIQAKPEEYQTLNIKGFGIAGFQYLRMLFGADTTKPDVHVIGFLSETLHRRVSELEALRLLEVASERLGLSVRDVDTYIWEIRARTQQDASVSNITDTDVSEKASVEYSEFWAPIREGKGLFAGRPVPIRDENAISKTIKKVQVWLFLNKHRCYIRLYFLKPNHFERRDKIMQLFPESDYDYEYKDTARLTTVIFSVLDKGKNDRDDWDEIREKLVTMGTDIYNKINESGL